MDFLCDVPVREHEGLWEHVLWRVLVLYYESYFDDQNFIFHIHCTKKRFVQFYYANIVDVHYVLKVDNVISVVFHNKPL